MTNTLTKQELIAFALEIKTLDVIRKTLKLKGNSYMYVKNTNKKYGKDLKADQELSDDVADIIILNTLGKLNRMNEQYLYLKAMSLRDTSGIQEQIERIDNQSHANNETLDKARKIVEKDNLANNIIDKIEVVVKGTTPAKMARMAHKSLVDSNEPNIEYIDEFSSLEIYNKKMAKLIELYKKGL